MAGWTAEVSPAPARVPAAAGGWLLLLAGAALLAGAVAFLWPLGGQLPASGTKWSTVIAVAFGVALASAGIGRVASRTAGLTPALMALVVALLAVEALLRAFAVPPGLIPTPSRVGLALAETRMVLLSDAYVTFVLEALGGYVIGVLAGIVAALLIVRFVFLERGFLPYAGLFSSIPIVALAPVIVKAVGLEWTSKAVIVAITVFFPVVVNVVRGLQSADPLHLDLMRTYAVSPARTFALVRVPAALPFLFNALKIATTLAMIGAIVGEFFGTTGQGLGFRIQIESGRFNLDIVWAAIVVASVLGIAFYAVVQWLEHRLTVRPGGRP